MNDSDLVVESTTRFALDLYRVLGKIDGNLFFSPGSIAIALAMAYAGARGETAREMAATMHLPDLDPARLHAAFGFLLWDFNYEYAQPEGDDPALLALLRKHSDDKDLRFADGENVVDPTACLVRMANAIWWQSDLGYLDSYRHILRSFYESDLQQVDFASNPEQALRQINSWVAEKTLDKIPELLSPCVIDNFTRLVLTNAVYFKAQWDEAFSESKTNQLPFYLVDGNTQSVDMMSKIGVFRYVEDDFVQVLELPYVGGQFAMLIILPKERKGLEAVGAQLSFEQLRDWCEAFTSVEVDLLLPKFKFHQHSMLADVLREMGMRLAFDDTADFSGMTGIEPLKESDERLKPENLAQNIVNLPIVISEVIHESFINLDEIGTEAAAATAVVMTYGASFHERPKPVEFHADHPFVFAIMETTKGVPLFLGRMERPNS
jgi:serpin B